MVGGVVTESKPRPLTPRQARFVAEYVKDGNATQAAIRAGYSEATAMQQGSRLLSHVEVNRLLVEVGTKAVERAAVALATEDAVASAGWIIEQSVRLYERCIQDAPVLDKHGEPIGVYEFDSGGANRALDRLAKRLPEWKDNTTVNVGVGVTVTRNTRSTH